MIHCYRQNGFNIVLDTNSGSVHSVDDLAFDVISQYDDVPRGELTSRMLEKYADDADVTPDELETLYADIESLRDAGKLFSEDKFSDLRSKTAERGEIKALCLHVSHVCNLTCDYCFASHGRYNGERALMSLDTGRRAIDFLVERSGKRRNLEVDFFGGEPLMNWDVVKGIVTYARSIEAERGKRFRFTLTTNGMLIDDDVIDFANREMQNVVLSLDGRREIHDAKRRTPDGGGSYDVIVPKFQKLVASRGGKNYYIRGTFTRANTDFTNDLFHMADLGFRELSMEPVVASGSDEYALRREDLPELMHQYEYLASELLRREKAGETITFYHYMLDLTRGPCVYKRVSGCGSGTEYLAVTPWGELFPCHQFVGKPEYSMGNIFDGAIDGDIRREFAQVSAYAKEACRECWARMYCSGGCAANAFHATGDINGVYEFGCELFRKRIECAVMMQVAKSEGD